jgi:hypothetical protein
MALRAHLCLSIDRLDAAFLGLAHGPAEHLRREAAVDFFALGGNLSHKSHCPAIHASTRASMAAASTMTSTLPSGAISMWLISARRPSS